MSKEFVKVIVEIDEAGKKIPRSLYFEDKEYIVDRVLEMKNCASFKAGGIGERYKVRIKNNETYLFFENGKWFVESK
ncbi:MAG: hypothetical protein IJW59_02590 [Clostridia bacterium]|nr:hypothetical protein [Clostridia bacterium]